jgi:hypothetical protein
MRAISTASRTVTGKNQFTVSTCGTYPTASPGRRRTRPAMGLTEPATAFSRVLLPDPLGPTTPRKSPASTRRSTFTRTGSCP